MKKIIKLIIACLVTAPFRALAADPAYLTSSFTVIKSVMASLVVAMIGLAVVWFTWNVIKYAMSADEKGKEQAKSQMVWGIITITVIVSVWGLVNILRVLFRIGDANSNLPTGTDQMIPDVTSTGSGEEFDFGGGMP